mgnify:CR=1 FL=1
MTGGEISGNYADSGGGIYVDSNYPTFTMTGGIIENNSATSPVWSNSKGGGC